MATSTGAAGANAVASALFFGTTTAAPPPAADGPSILLVPDRGPAPLDIQAMALGIEPGTARTWDFGDGTTAQGDVAVHTYFSPGVCTVTLRAGGKTARATVVVEATQGQQP